MKYKLIYLSAVSTLFITGCATVGSFSEVTKPDYSDIEDISSISKKLNYSSSNPEMQCFGDLQATYETWNLEPQYPYRRESKYNISILPVTNQTVVPSTKIPFDMSLVAQSIASKAGIGYNVIYLPSITDVQMAPNFIYGSYTDLLTTRAASTKAKLASSSSQPKERDVTIIASLTEFDVSNEDTDSISSRVTDKTKKGKSYSAGYSGSDQSYRGKITMLFNTAYFAKTGDYKTPQLIYNPNTSTEVTINFEDKANSDEFSFSYDGGNPSVGYKSVYSTQDSKFAAINLLIERGLVKTLGKYQRIPYWRCYAENQISNKVKNKNGESVVVEPVGTTPLKLQKTREVSGYDSDIEHMTRRMFNYFGNNIGLGPYRRRLPKIENGNVFAFVAEVSSKSSSPWNISQDNANVKSIQLPMSVYKQYRLDVCKKQPQNVRIQKEITRLTDMINGNPTSSEVPSLKANISSLNAQFKSVTNNCKKQRTLEFNRTIPTYVKGKDKLWVLQQKSDNTGQAFFNRLRLVSQQNINSGYLAGNKDVYDKYLKGINRNLSKKTISEEDAFVELWMNAPYEKNARIYPLYLNKIK